MNSIGAVANQKLQRVAVVGAGYMGGGIAQVLALSGLDVVLADVDAERASGARQRLIEEGGRFAASGLFAEDAEERLEQRLTAGGSIAEAVDGADYITEAVFEARDTKKDALAQISAAARPDAIIGTNTSAIPISELSTAVRGPERFLGVHWMNPAPFIPGVELIPGPHTAPAVVDAVEDLIRLVGKVPARVADTPGFVANRLQFALFKEAVKVVEEGLATPEQVDLVVSNAFGFRLALFGPFAIADMAGLDVYAASYDSLEAAYGDRLSAPETLRKLVGEGHLGTKTGGGFLDIKSSAIADLLTYRDHAYRALSGLRQQIGPPPGL